MAKFRQSSGSDSKIKFAKRVKIKNRAKQLVYILHILTTVYLLYCNLKGL